MAKQSLVINQFHGGLNSEADARDIMDHEFSALDNFRVDQLGQLTVLGPFDSYKTTSSYAVNPGTMGLFAWSSDIQNASGKCDNGSGISGNHDGSSGVSYLGDSGESFPVGKMIGATLKNTTDSSEGIVVSNTSNSIVTESKHRITNFADGTDGNASDVQVTTASAHGINNGAAVSITGTQNYNGSWSGGDVDDASGSTLDLEQAYVAEQPSASALLTTNLSGGTDNDWDNGDAWQLHNLENATVGDHYLVYMDADSSNNFYIYSHNWDHTSSAKNIGGSSIPEPVFFQADGDLRVGDGNFGNNSSCKWYGHIKRGRFNNGPTESACSNAKQSYNEWYLTDQWVKRPPRAEPTVLESPYQSYEADDAYATDTGWPGSALAAGIVQLAVSANKFDDGLITGYKKYWYSYIYDGKQESPLRGFLGYDSVWENSKKRYRITLNPTSLDKRITGIRIYWQHVTSAVIPEDEVYLLLEADLDLGVKKANVDTYEPWVENSIGGVFHVRNDNMIEFDAEPRLYTYSALSGMLADESCSFAKYKTAVVANRKTYYGNVLLHHDAGSDLTDGIRLEHKGDAMVKSPTNSFDVMPGTSVLEAVVNDGDDIVKLEEFADRILQFKKNNLYIINVSQDVEFLEATFQHRGIPNPTASVRTELGVAFVNKNGAYIYDGKQLVDIFDGKVGKRISASDWATFITDTASIGYDPINNNLIIRGDSSSGGTNGNCYVFNLKVFSWSKASDLLADNSDGTNFVNDYDGTLILKDGATAIKKYNSTGGNDGASNMSTKDIDFGNAGVRKKVFKVRVTYKSAGTVPTLVYEVNGKEDGQTRTFSGSFATSKTQWTTQDFVANGSDTYLNNLYTLKLLLSGTNISGFYINDISIIYRLKRAK